MPANARSLQLTDSYRERLVATRSRLQTRAEQLWPTIETLDRTQWVERMEAALAQGQKEAVRLTSAYLGAYLTSETGKRTTPPPIDLGPYVGKSRDGRPLSDSLRSPLVGTLGKLKEGLSAADSLSYGLNRATRMVGIDFDDAHRTALVQTIDSDERFDGWQRALAGTCGACASTASGVSHGLRFPVHPGCQCVSEPVVKGVPNTFPIPTGAEVFNAKTPAEQDEMLGPDAAAMVREGQISLADLHDTSTLEQGEDFITQKPIKAIQ